jgi:hypothetical protein
MEQDLYNNEHDVVRYDEDDNTSPYGNTSPYKRPLYKTNNIDNYSIWYHNFDIKHVIIGYFVGVVFGIGIYKIFN